MMMSPNGLDLWLAKILADFAQAHPQIALAVESGINHTLFGGFWFGAALFILWVYSASANNRQWRVRVLTIVAASVAVILLTIAAGALISWPPPMNNHAFKYLYPSAMQDNVNTNSFPSQSTAAYAVIAAGIYSVNKMGGYFLWILMGIFIALSRMLVGGHYFTDVAAGTVLAAAAYTATRYLLEANLISKMDALLEARPLTRFLMHVAVFFWIVQVTVEFRELTWAKAVIEFFIR